ncbi:energy transducer TonB [Hymenobacter lapidiphilus]|uniref:energy transducer TonB n=1 Tax=Hymenobacter sp. CCM 8763 TaxID=2303334 RepID=UPI000E34BADB|nr:energy transducer TonB [Hymenobacter sp. CCM 8763]RFP66679.1 energy transducer TonB [Hymenobacter sp. CCM 8763]
MKFIVIISGVLLATCAAGTATAQEAPVRTTIYQMFKDSVVTASSDAVYRIQRTQVAGRSQLDSVFYVASNRLYRVKTITWQPNGDTLTVVEGWRSNGQTEYVSHELGNKTHGEYRAYNTQGRLQKIAQFDHGKEQSAKCFSKTGALVSCNQYKYTEKLPEFPGGQQALLDYIGRTLRYPTAALKQNLQGVVKTAFVVAETGEVRCLQIKQGLWPELDAEALRVLASLPRFKPGQQNGETVPVYFTLPITFAIE